MTGKQVFWGCALAGYIIFAATVFYEDSISGFCLLLISAGIAAIVGIIYALVKFVNWIGNEPGPAARAAQRQPNAAIRSKEVAKVIKHSDANTAALLQYIYDAVRDGLEGEAIRGSLLKKGWSENQVRAAFSSYQDMLARYPRQEKTLTA